MHCPARAFFRGKGFCLCLPCICVSQSPVCSRSTQVVSLVAWLKAGKVAALLHQVQQANLQTCKAACFSGHAGKHKASPLALCSCCYVSLHYYVFAAQRCVGLCCVAHKSTADNKNVSILHSVQASQKHCMHFVWLSCVAQPCQMLYDAAIWCARVQALNSSMVCLAALSQQFSNIPRIFTTPSILKPMPGISVTLKQVYNHFLLQ